MSAYRLVARHIRYWRGAPHRWSNSFTYTGQSDVGFDTQDLVNFRNIVSDLCYEGPEHAGGIYKVDAYDLVRGGQPIATIDIFNPEVPGEWQGYTSNAWTSHTLELDATAENALVIEFAGGVGRTGKRVVFKHWLHAVPAVAPVGSGAQVAAGDVASLTARAGALRGVFGGKGLVLGSQSGRIAGEASVQAYYGNHQMPKGRRRTAAKALKQDNSILRQLIAKSFQDAQDG